VLTIPHDRIVCSLWTAQPPSQVQLVEACGPVDLSAYRLDVISNGITLCSKPAAALQNIVNECALSGRLDQYRLNIVQPDYQDAICTVSTDERIEPTREEVISQCPKAPARYQLRFTGTRDVKPATVTICKPPAVTQPASIATEENYYLLAGKLIWYGLSKSACDGGYSGIDDLDTFAATPCGLAGAREDMIAWQNNLDRDILAAASIWNVPADLLKEIIASETQFWPWTGTDGEHGLIQITEDGAAVVLHVYMVGYYKLDPEAQHQARIAWLNQLDCFNCSPVAAYERARSVMPLYAQALAAYYCMYGSWNEAVRVWNIKHEIGEL